ncbi:MAG: hypothetical protein JW782_05035 [Candidatus Saganbacteria bacterium]|nr:hypothetical protein [Candidatus Saganbacteria bacterium]
MNERNVDKRNFDVASISRPGRANRTNYIQNALQVDRSKLPATGQFFDVLADMILTRTAGKKSYF